MQVNAPIKEIKLSNYLFAIIANTIVKDTIKVLDKFSYNFLFYLSNFILPKIHFSIISLATFKVKG